MDKIDYTQDEIVSILEKIVGKTLGQIDSKKVFDKTIINKKVTGIAGDVIEQSVFGYPQNSSQEPDLIIDGEKVELKTTGLREVEKSSKSKYNFEAKEPMSITAVSPNKIVDEDFENSNLWHKLERMLIVYYLYNSKETVKASEYSDFPVQGYHFNFFDEQDKEIIKNDWNVVKEFVLNVKNNDLNIEEEYPKISKLREKMLYLDTAPKYPNPPRFRLKRNVVTALAQKHFGLDFTPLKGDKRFTSFTELDNILGDFTRRFFKKSVKDIAKDVGIKLVYKNGVVSKQINEQLMTAAFGINSGKITNIETFAKIGVIPKTITLTKSGARTEDTKFQTIDFTEFVDEGITFEDSSLYDYFINNIFLFIIFEEPYNNSPIEDNIFIGFKRLRFSEEFIFKHIKKTWIRIKDLIQSNEFNVTPVINKDGTIAMNKKTKTIKEKTNLPKSKDNIVFVRGTSKDSTVKLHTLNGYKIYSQQYWIKGSFLVKMLDDIKFI